MLLSNLRKSPHYIMQDSAVIAVSNRSCNGLFSLHLCTVYGALDFVAICLGCFSNLKTKTKIKFKNFSSKTLSTANFFKDNNFSTKTQKMWNVKFKFTPTTEWQHPGNSRTENRGPATHNFFGKTENSKEQCQSVRPLVGPVTQRGHLLLAQSCPKPRATSRFIPFEQRNSCGRV